MTQDVIFFQKHQHTELWRYIHNDFSCFLSEYKLDLQDLEVDTLTESFKTLLADLDLPETSIRLQVSLIKDIENELLIRGDNHIVSLLRFHREKIYELYSQIQSIANHS